MLRKDYIVREFEAIGKVLASILLLKKQVSHEEYQTKIDELIKQYSSLEMLDASQSLENIVQKVSLLEQPAGKVIAMLCFEKMLSCEISGDLDNFQRYGQIANQLYRRIESDSVSGEYDLDVHLKLKMLAEKGFN